ncbi:hypothetical protein ACIQMY_25405 [Streptomyces sp. NPDC091368]|uniref:hypothetical protein n=1 Tax=Streptomyces sp. NPDC091368 TaxID=3365993 RepID=UPI0038277274
MTADELPDRSELVGKEVHLELHPWAAPGPCRGTFLGQGERGLSIRIQGGGRYTYRHDQVKGVREVSTDPREELARRIRAEGQRDRRRLAVRLALWMLLLAAIITAWALLT